MLAASGQSSVALAISDDLMHSIHVFDSDELSLEILPKKLVVTVERKDLLLTELADQKLLHL